MFFESILNSSFRGSSGPSAAWSRCWLEYRLARNIRFSAVSRCRARVAPARVYDHGAVAGSGVRPQFYFVEPVSLRGHLRAKPVAERLIHYIALFRRGAGTRK